MNPLASMGFSFLKYFGIALFSGLLLLGATYPIWIKRFFYIPFIKLKNAGGGKDQNTIVLDKKIVVYGRIQDTVYGQRVKIRGVKYTQPLSLVSRENAIPWEAGGVAYMIYEKEIGQFASIDPELQDIEFDLPKTKKLREQVELAYKKLMIEFPDIRDYFRLSPNPDKLLRPVIFRNETVNIRPFPVDMVTQTMYDMKARQDRIINTPGWQKWLPWAIMGLASITIIVVAVLSFEQINKSGEAYLSQVNSAGSSFADRVAEKIRSGSGDTPPGKIFIPLLPFMFRRKKFWQV